ncbi:hypothetical protein EAE96_004672 [Botrytis aclada]|nr:hypothetical protein EAE96_004672 [Botrytis aclada]
MGFLWSSRKDKNPPPPVPTGKKRKGSNKSVQQAAKSKENTKHATAATSDRGQRGDCSTNGATMTDTVLVTTPKMRSGSFTNLETMSKGSGRGTKKREGSRWGTVARVLEVGMSKNHNKYDGGR